MEKQPHRHIGQKDPGGCAQRRQQGIQSHKQQGEGHQDIHHAKGLQTGPQQFVMDVVAVGQKQALARAVAYQHHPHNIKTRYDKSGQRNQRSAFGPGITIGIAVHEDQQSVGKHIAETQTAGIAHKELEVALTATVHIIVPERQHDAKHAGKKKQI